MNLLEIEPSFILWMLSACVIEVTVLIVWHNDDLMTLILTKPLIEQIFILERISFTLKCQTCSIFLTQQKVEHENVR